MASGRLIDYLGEGTFAARPASLTLIAGGLGIYWATDTNAVYLWNGSAWAALPAAGGATWGSITGTLSTQTDLQNALNAKENLGILAGINDQTGTSYTLVLADVAKDVRCTNAAAITLTIPPNSSVAFTIGSWLLFSQGGAGVVTATSGAGVTIRAANGAATTAQYDIRGLEKTDTDTWRVV